MTLNSCTDSRLQTSDSRLEKSDDVREVVAPEFEFVVVRVERLPARVRRERAEVFPVARDDAPRRRVASRLRLIFFISEDACGKPCIRRDAADHAFEFEAAVRDVE